MAKQIIVIVEGDRNIKKEKLSSSGALTIFDAVYGLATFSIHSRIFCGDDFCTWQSAMIASAALGYPGDIEKIHEFYCNSSTLKKFQSLSDTLTEKTVAEALKSDEAVQTARSKIQSGIQRLYKEIHVTNTLLVFSHPFYTELGVPYHQIDSFKFGLASGDSVVYTIKNGAIINADLIKAPIYF